MNYLSAGEAAAKWGISVRYVQRCCLEGRIPGATKLGRSWAIPDDVSCPGEAAEVHPTPTDPPVLRLPMPLVNTAFAPGCHAAAIAAMPDAESRALAEAEYAYFSGQPERAVAYAEPFLHHRDPALRLSACWIYGYASFTLDRIAQAHAAMAEVKRTLAAVDADTPPASRALAVFVATASAVLLHLPLPEGMPPMKQCISLLPPGLRLFALYVEAHQAYLDEQYGVSIGIVETALALGGDAYPIASIYLHLVATMDHMSLRQPDAAREHLLAAWAMAKPDDLIQPFGEHHGLLGGMLEAALKHDYPEDFRRIIAITYRFSAGWRKIHNPMTGHAVADNLTTTEFAAAMLAARDWSNKEIAAHMDISEHTVRNYIASALQKLNIAQRKDLKAYMLQ